MQLSLILAVLSALALADHTSGGPVPNATARLLWALGGIGLVTGYAAAASGLVVRRLRFDWPDHRSVLRSFQRLRNVHAILWLGTVVGIAYGLQWGQLVRCNWNLEGAFLIDEVLILSPVLLPLIFSWAAFYQVDRVLHLQHSGDSALVGHCTNRLSYLLFHARHNLAILMVPLLGLLAVQDGLELLAPEMTNNNVVLLVAMTAILLLFPVFLRYAWKTQPLPAGPLRERLESAAQGAGLRVREILVWHTDGMIVNAAVAGFVRPWRYVFLSDGLLERLDDREIEAVFAHEMGHVRLYHLPLRVLALIAPLSLYLLIAQAFPEAAAWLRAEYLDLGTLLPGPKELLLPGALILYMVFVFGRYCRRLEYQADLFACFGANDDPEAPMVDTFISALEKLALTSTSGRMARNWQHASIAKRVDFLKSLRLAPNRKLRFHQEVHLLGSMVIGVVLSPLVYWLLTG